MDQVALKTSPLRHRRTGSSTLGVDVVAYSVITAAIALIIGVVVLNPLWTKYAPPFPFPKVLPPICAPADGVFYLRNADHGYQWKTEDPLSLWFHPLLAWVVSAAPNWQPSRVWFLITSVAFAVGSIILTHRFVRILSGFESASARLLPLCLLAPGGLSIATGNAELPTLFFTLATLISVLHWRKWWLTASTAALAILVKPNALYMVPVLLTYLVFGLAEKNHGLCRHAVLGTVTLVVTWLLWMGVVDWHAGRMGAYWSVRMSSRGYVAGDAWSFFDQLARSFLYGSSIRERVRYSSALVIPLASLWLIGYVRLSDESHRYAMAAGNIAMLAVALYMGNPNKIIVYVTTLPSHFATHVLVLDRLGRSVSLTDHPLSVGPAAMYGGYCACMILLYVLGTPLAWYY
jgi:hypothetical protein